MQLDRQGELVEPKTAQAKRDVNLPPFLVRMLQQHKLASRYSCPDDFVFASETGTPLYYRNITMRGLDKAVERAKIADLKPRWYDLRQTAASLLITRD